VPTTDEHLVQAERNEQLSHTLELHDPAWAVTMLFYAAVHYLEAYFDAMPTRAGFERHYEQHVSRHRAVRQRLPSLQRHYQTLYDESIEARYKYTLFTPDDVVALRDNQFAAIKSQVLRRIEAARGPSR
jgi:hypothetical protein